jgi:3-deoxy-D-manno-octulosonate 8-phosphate phosphatase (KDO 8-P phosphatase)
MSALSERARRIRLAAFDVDGTLNDGTLVYPGEGHELKHFHVQDGLGLKLLSEFGIATAIITARESEAVRARARELGIVHLAQAAGDKRRSLAELAGSMGLGPDACCFMGDDLTDLGAMSLSGLAVAPANAHPWVRARVHWVTPSRGGAGAARELCDLLLDAQGHADAVLARFLPDGR